MKPKIPLYRCISSAWVETYNMQDTNVLHSATDSFVVLISHTSTVCYDGRSGMWFDILSPSKPAFLFKTGLCLVGKCYLSRVYNLDLSAVIIKLGSHSHLVQWVFGNGVQYLGFWGSLRLHCELVNGSNVTVLRENVQCCNWIHGTILSQFLHFNKPWSVVFGEICGTMKRSQSAFDAKCIEIKTFPTRLEIVGWPLLPVPNCDPILKLPLETLCLQFTGKYNLYARNSRVGSGYNYDKLFENSLFIHVILKNCILTIQNEIILAFGLHVGFWK